MDQKATTTERLGRLYGQVAITDEASEGITCEKVIETKAKRPTFFMLPYKESEGEKLTKSLNGTLTIN